MHGGGSGRRRPSSRNKADWSSSVIGSHASGSRGPQSQRRASAHSRRPRTSAVPSRRTGEVRQIHIQSRSVDERTSRRKVGQSRTESFMRHRDNVSRITLIVGIILIVVILFQPRGIMGWYNGSKFKVKVNDMFDRMDGKK